MVMMDILVTGGAGFIGSWIAESLISSGHTVTVIDDLSGGDRANIPAGAKFFRLDLANSEPCVLSGISPDILIHCAANAREGASFFQPVSIVRRNTLAYVNTLTHCVNSGVKKVVLLSSMAVYGNQTPPFTEDMSIKPADIYGLQKANMEQMTQCLAQVHGFDFTIIRPHNVFGPRQALFDKFRNVIGIWMNRIMREEDLIVFGDGQQKRAFSYIEDSLFTYVLAALGDMTNGQIINIGGDTPVTINHALSLVKKAMGVNGHYPTKHLPDRTGEVKEAYCNHHKAETLLGFKNTIGFEGGIQRMASWALEKGPQEWRETDKLEIDSPLIPSVWRRDGPTN
jgi:UDP-glucose 4-epimerase